MNHVVIAFSIIACLSLVGCENSSSGASSNTVFKNESSATVTVSPANDEAFGAFTLAPNEATTVARVGDAIDYTFTATGEVVEIPVTNIEVLFSDPIVL